MTTLIIYGYLTTIKGPAEEHFIVELDSDGRGIECPAFYNPQNGGTFTMKQGLNTYTGTHVPLSSLTIQTTHQDLQEQDRQIVGTRWCGNFFHDEYGGIEGDIPRGSFWLRVSKLPSQFSSRDCKLVSLDGSTTSVLAIGKPLKMVLAYVEEEVVAETSANAAGEDEKEKKSMMKGKKLLSHPGTFDPTTNDCVVTEVTNEYHHSESGGGKEEEAESNVTVLRTEYRGKWSHTQQNEKFCGFFVTRNGQGIVVESGSFFTEVSAISVE